MRKRLFIPANTLTRVTVIRKIVESILGSRSYAFGDYEIWERA